MGSPKKLYFAVTNDLSFDQRMIRICTSLSSAGYEVVLVGRSRKNSIPLTRLSFRQVRLACLAQKGLPFYAEFNLRLFFFLLTRKMDLVCAIDLDTILPCWLVSILKKAVRVYDAHELFCEMKEVVTRPQVRRVWKAIEKFTVPKFALGYTVNAQIADLLTREYGNPMSVIRNVPVLQPAGRTSTENFIIYQGAVNEGRCFETLIPAMKDIDMPLRIFGDGNFLPQARQLVGRNHLEEKIIFEGSQPPEHLRDYTRRARVGMTLFENTGLSNYLSLGNRFFDYIHAELPQVCVDYPAYHKINQEYEVALLIPDCSPASIANAINRLLHDDALYRRLQKNCALAREELCWQREEQVLIEFYRTVFPP